MRLAHVMVLGAGHAVMCVEAGCCYTSPQIAQNLSRQQSGPCAACTWSTARQATALATCAHKAHTRCTCSPGSPCSLLACQSSVHASILTH
jgi:hypothetical protein